MFSHLAGHTVQAVTVGSLHDHQVTAGFAVEHSHQEIEVIIIPYDLHVPAPEQGALRLGQGAAKGHAELLLLI